MPTIDELQIELTGSTSRAGSAIDSLVRKLQGLNSALNIKLGDGLVGGLHNLSDGLRSVSLAVDGMDVGKLKDVSSAFRSLSTQGKNLAALSDSTKNASKGFAGLSSVVQGLQSLSEIGQMPDLTSVKTLADSMNKLSGENVKRASDSLPKVGEAIESLNGITIPNLEGLGGLATGLRSLGSKTVVNAASSLPHLVNALRQVENIRLPEGLGGIAELSNAIRQFGYKSATAAIDNIPKIAAAFNKMASTLSRAPVVKSNTIKLAQAMAQLAANSGRASLGMGKASKGLSLFNLSAMRTQKSTKSLASTIGKITATYWLLFRVLGKVKQAMDLASDLTEVQNVVDQTFKNEAGKMEEFAKSATEQFGMAELQAKKVGSRFQAMGKAMGIPNSAIEKTSRFLAENSRMYGKEASSMADMSIELTKLTADMGSFYNMDYDEVAEKMESIFTGQTRPLRTFGLDLTEATLKEWAMKNGLDANIKSMTQAQKAMLRYQYVMAQTGAAQGDFARTADTWANQTRMLKQNFQSLGIVIGKTFINAFKPAVKAMNAFLVKVTSFAEQVFNALGQIFGWQVEINAAGIAEDYEDAARTADGLADGTGDAAKNAKELNKQLASFDRLNNLTTPKDNAGGGGGGGGGTSGGGGGGGSAGDGGFVTTRFEKITSDIKDLETLGATIAESIARSLDNIDWDTVYEKARDFGTGLAEFLNGLFTGSEGEHLFESLGSTIAGAINTVMNATNAFSNEFNFEGLGDNIKEGVKSFLTNWDAELTGVTLGNLANGLSELLYESVSDKETWALLGEKVSEGINNFMNTYSSWETGLAVGELVSGFANAVYTVVSDKSKWENLGSKIADGINGFISSMSEENPITGKNGFEALLGDFGSIADGVGKAVYTAITDIKWKKVLNGAFDGLKEFFSSFTWEGTIGLITILGAKLAFSKGAALVLTGVEAAQTLVGTVIGSALGKIAVKLTSLSLTIGSVAASALSGTSLSAAIGTAFGAPAGAVAGGLATGFTIAGAATVTLATAVTIGAVTGEKVTDGISKWFRDAGFDTSEYDKNKTLKDKLTFAFESLAKVADPNDDVTLGEWLKLAKDAITISFNVKVEDAKTKLSTWWDNIKSYWKDKALEVGLKMLDIAKSVGEWWSNVKEYWKDNKVVSVGLKLVDDTISNLWKSVQEKWGLSKTLKVLLGTFKDAISNMWSSIQSTWGNNKTLKIILSETKTAISNLWSSITSKWGENKTLKTGLKLIGSAVSSLWNTVKDKWNSTTRALKVGLSLLGNALSDLWETITNFFKGKSVDVKASSDGSNFEKGGVFKHQKWHDIPQFANGGTMLPSHGSMFIAGEHGSEIVGHIGGQTEVLNQSQLASVMYSAVSNAMAQQNAILLKQNEYLSGILAKNYGISSKDIFNATRSEANSYFNRTGRPAFES